MNILEAIFLNSVFILLPLFSYFLFVTNERNLNKRTSSILFDLALYSSLYFMLKCDTTYTGIKIMFLTVPLLIAYLKSKNMTTIIFSICIASYYIQSMQLSILYTVIEFLIYFIFMYFLKKRNESDTTIISVFVIIKITFIILELDIINVNNIKILEEIVILPFAFYFTTHMICYLMAASEKTMSLHMTMKELEHQKQLRDSLFKITHEIKNPIAVCKGYLDMFDADNPDHVRRYIPIVKQEIERTLTLMNDFMMFTKLNVDKKKMDASVMLQDVCEMSSIMIKENKFKFSSQIIDDDVYIDGDYDRLKQVLINVIKNAIEAIPNGKKGQIKFNAKVTSKELIVIVTDNGMGMTKKVLSKIGEAFYTTKKGGTGLGVKLSNEIIEAHGGYINYKSKPNIGTTVTIALPLKKSL